MGTTTTLPVLLRTPAIRNRFNEMLGKNATTFISSLMTIYAENDKLQKCEPDSVLKAAAQAANLGLPIMPQFGYAYVIPYYDTKGGKYIAQFQLGYKGMIQLAIRSGLFLTLNSTEIYEGQIKNFNEMTKKTVLKKLLLTYAPNVQASPKTFPARNRIIA